MTDPVTEVHFKIDDKFNIPDRFVVVTGKLLEGTIRISDKLRWEGQLGKNIVIVSSIEKFKQPGLTSVFACEESIGLELEGVRHEEIQHGDVLFSVKNIK